jgi:hypothetical protein
VDESLNITAAIDCEFYYTAPAQVAGSIPRWLLLQKSHRIVSNHGRGTFFDGCIPEAELSLQALERKENEKGVHDQLSTRMRQPIEDKSAWFNLACRVGLSVDLIYLDLLNEYCW